MNIKETTFKIKRRIYNGVYGIGSILNHESIFIIQQSFDNTNHEDGLIKYRESIEFCCNEMLGGNDLANICMEIPYLVKYDKINRFNELIENIKSDINYKYNENHYSKDIFDPRYLSYMDIIIDNEEFETDDESILEVLNDIINIKSYSKLNDEYYAKISNIMQKQNGHYYFEENNETISSKSDSLSSNLIPDNLKYYVSFDEDGYAFAKQKLPKELENDYNTFIKNYYSNDNKVVNNIVDRIDELPYNTETTIAQLIDYKPAVEFVSPLTQEIVSNSVRNKCKSNNIELEETDDSLGGLAYYVKFKKNDHKITKVEIDETDSSIKKHHKKYVYSIEERNSLFEKDENYVFVRLVIPKVEGINEEELDLIGKLPKDYTLGEIITAKKYANYIYERVLNPSGKKDIEHTVEVLVNVIDELPKGTEISISQILGNHFKDYETSELFEINQKVISVCREKGIILNFDKYKKRDVGLPYTIPFIRE